MQDENRGKIHNREYATQVRDFSGLRFGNITPTDIDGLIEYQNICYVWIETKFEGAELPRGQELALERVCDDLNKVKPCVVIVASHNSHGDIDVANTTVSKVRWKGEWKPREGVTTREFVEKFIDWVTDWFTTGYWRE